MRSDSELRDRLRQPQSHVVLIGLALSLLLVAACREGGANIRDCSQWRTESIPGCYDGQGGGDMN
jgi:hypothetical protein